MILYREVTITISPDGKLLGSRSVLHIGTLWLGKAHRMWEMGLILPKRRRTASAASCKRNPSTKG